MLTDTLKKKKKKRDFLLCASEGDVAHALTCHFTPEAVIRSYFLSKDTLLYLFSRRPRQASSFSKFAWRSKTIL